MIYKLPAHKQAELVARVEFEHGTGWHYVHTVRGIGPDGQTGTVDVLDNRAYDWDERRNVHVLDGKILRPV